MTDPPPPSRPNDVTIDVGEGRLPAVVYDELRAIASRHLASERPGQPLRPTELVHEAYVRLSEASDATVTDRTHFYRLASRVMRHVLVDAARRRGADKRGGGARPLTLHGELVSDEGRAMELLELHEALRRLGRLDARLEQLVELRFFTGLTLAESAAALGVSPRKASKDWAAAKLWLRRELAPS